MQEDNIQMLSIFHVFTFVSENFSTCLIYIGTYVFTYVLVISQWELINYIWFRKIYRIWTGFGGSKKPFVKIFGSVVRAEPKFFLTDQAEPNSGFRLCCRLDPRTNSNIFFQNFKFPIYPTSYIIQFSY